MMPVYIFVVTDNCYFMFIAISIYNIGQGRKGQRGGETGGVGI
jgi:hypothetical protein